ncbi:hypothetical protein BV20DRAFT_972447 [Pilatotrama ljubarskyi]|nr:hypothetical protein BV20DRAFT_972447 [Pilatotrama ljubarskyi]
MHHCLLLPDIFNRILDFLLVLPPDDFYAAKQQLEDKNPSIAALARTCRGFLEPSLNALWKHQRTLSPLVQTLPSDAYEETIDLISVSASSSPPYIDILLTRPLVRSDWCRFDYYAPRIKALGFFHNEHGDQEGYSWCMPSVLPRAREVPWQTVSLLCLYRRGRWLLPNLVRLRWNLYDYLYTAHVPLFLGPSLRSLAFALEPTHILGDICDPLWEEDMARNLRALAQLCPTLTDLEMYPGYAGDIVPSASHFAYTCRHLEGYHVNTFRHQPLQRDFLEYLALKPFLRKVFLSLDHETADNLPLILSPPHVPHPFSSLQILYLQVPHLSSCTAFINSMEQCRLFSAAVEVNHRPLATDVYDFFAVLRGSCAKHTLHVCRLIQSALAEDDSDIAQHPDHSMDGSVLKPILQFPNMRLFMFGIPMCGWLTDEDFDLIGKCWPGLVAFAFIDRWATIGVSPATWRGVASLVSQTPLLTDLRVTFDTRRNLISKPTDVPGLRPNHQLRFFEVLCSVLPEDPALFALSLFTIAPRVVEVKGGGWPVDPDGIPSEDPYAFREQVRGLMFRLRMQHFGEEYMTDEMGKMEITEGSGDSLPSEWNPWK